MDKLFIPITPPTEEEIMLIQPNNVTFGQYNISEWQENLLTLISDKLQKHMTRKKNCHVICLICPMLLSDAMKQADKTTKQRS